MEIFGVIMAGGSGTRFWPISTKLNPKQFLNLSGKDILINQAIERLQGVCKENVFVVSCEFLGGKIKDACKDKVIKSNVLLEPMQKNTAISIAYAAIKIIKKYGDGVLVITPSDAYIKEQNKFENALRLATQKAKDFNKIITVGIKPTYAATGYGYIKIGENLGDFYKVLQFVEKPKKEIAKTYLKSKNYLWNSGIFICKASVILNEIKKFMPKVYTDFISVYDFLDTENEREYLYKIYKNLQSVSIDYAVMEKAQNMLVILGDFGWSDVGSWDALSKINKADSFGNVSVGNVSVVEGQNNIVYSTDKLVVLFGVNNLVVAQTEKAILVCEKQRSQEIKELLNILENNGQGGFL